MSLLKTHLTKPDGGSREFASVNIHLKDARDDLTGHSRFVIGNTSEHVTVILISRCTSNIYKAKMQTFSLQPPLGHGNGFVWMEESINVDRTGVD